MSDATAYCLRHQREFYSPIEFEGRCDSDRYDVCTIRRRVEVHLFALRFGLTPGLGEHRRVLPDGRVLCLTDDGLDLVLGLYRSRAAFTRGKPIHFLRAASTDELLTLARGWAPVAEVER
jgi:hypothetical protein